MNGNVASSRDLGQAIRAARKSQRLRLEDVAAAAGTGIRFVSELERGKPTAQLGETLRVLHALGLRLHVKGPEHDGIA
jgi:HTH-type transcriptional regulator / antitoxin HipB